MMQSVDIAIVGGGMVGLTLAAALKNTDLRIAVIEGQEPSESFAELPDLRVSALSRSSENILQRVGAWSAMTQRRLAHIQPWRYGSVIALLELSLMQSILRSQTLVIL
ncbi:2-octaprenyl-3-methyl-6-methoxy-1,4-benzoquinol hydroxylase [Vibrio astriarenae]|nr:2-octaprenyl-3-methyl-6-methoxy-1,4-benzoquinol hydroxylase [Vibrio sp. C7]